MGLKDKLIRQLGDTAPHKKEPVETPKPVATSLPDSAPVTSSNAASEKRAILADLQKKLQKIAPTVIGTEPFCFTINEPLDPPQEREPKNSKSAVFDPESLPGAHVENSAAGEVFYVDSFYDLPYLHGDILLTSSSAALNELTANIACFAKDLSGALFFDLETTGLAGGTGTLPFMIGAGRLTGNSFQIRQYFVRTPAGEAAMLAHFMAFLGSSSLVSFNGKTFDLPLLISRLILNRLAGDLENRPHLDLIHLSRRLWRTRLKECNLKRLEECVMGINRSDDVDGGEVPQIYFDYLHGRPAPLMERVFYHNKIDILTLLALTTAIARQIRAAAAGQAQAEDLYSYGRHLCKEGAPEEAAAIFAMAADKRFKDHDVMLSNLTELAFCVKRLKGRPAAICHWQRLLELAPGNHLAMLEICKYLEHDLADYKAALIMAEKYASLPLSHDEREAISHRIQRLNDKLSGI